MTHTPGPWRYTHGAVITEWRQQEGATLYHRFICSVTSVRDKTNDDANGMLIAAAPELLEACKAALSELEHAHSVTNDAFNECDGATQTMLINALPEREDSAIPKLIGTIASAEGEQ